MKASRLNFVLAALIAVFVIVLGLAVGSLLAPGDPAFLVVCAVAAVAGLLAAGITCLVVRNAMQDEDLVCIVERPRQVDLAAPAVRVEALPVASLPAPYLAAVMKGVRANQRAMARQWNSPGSQDASR